MTRMGKLVTCVCDWDFNKIHPVSFFLSRAAANGKQCFCGIPCYHRGNRPIGRGGASGAISSGREVLTLWTHVRLTECEFCGTEWTRTWLYWSFLCILVKRGLDPKKAQHLFGDVVLVPLMALNCCPHFRC